MKNENCLLTRADAAKYLNLKKSTLEAWACRGGGPCFVKMGKVVRYRVSDLDVFIEENVKKNTTCESSGGTAPKKIDYLRMLMDVFGSNDEHSLLSYIPNIKTAVKSLRPREIYVLEKRYSGVTLEKTGSGMVNMNDDTQGIAKDTVRVIQAKALSRLRHPSRSRFIRGEIPKDIFLKQVRKT